MHITFTGKIDQLQQLVALAKTMPGVRFYERPNGIISLSADLEDGEGDKPTLERVNQLREARSLPPLAAL